MPRTAEPDQDSTTESIRIVVVDDHDMFAETLLRFLDSEPDLQVVGTAANGSQATEAVKRLSPDVVLLDFELPDEDGAVVATKIRAAQPDSKIVMMTGHAEERVLVAAIDAGCSGFLTKTKPIHELVHAVRAAHSGEAVIGGDMLARLLPRLRCGQWGVATRLTKREVEILRMVADGRSNRVIAADLFVAVATVRNHVQNIINKLGVHSKLEAVVKASRDGTIQFGSHNVA